MSDENRGKGTGDGRRGGPSLPPGERVDLAALVDYSDGSVVSRTLLGNRAGTVTLFSFDAGQGLSEHTAPFDALVLGIDGEGVFTVGGKECRVGAGQALLMPATIPHAVKAVGRLKMLLIMLRSGEKQPSGGA